MGLNRESTSPTLVPGVADAVDVAAGWLHSCAIESDGTARCWKQTGLVPDGWRDGGASVVAGVKEAIQIAVGNYQACAVSKQGTVSCWSHSSAASPNGEVAANVARPVPYLNDVVSIAMGGSHTCVVRKDETAWCWGMNDSGQLGDGTEVGRAGPWRVSDLDRVVRLSVGQDHVCSLLRGGSVRCWGQDRTSRNKHHRPVPVPL
jgi:alpha-tubulin suppressor-like RCC1 family protein